MGRPEPWWLVVEPVFRSHVPILGRLIAWFRHAWNSVATIWYVRPMVAQQNAINSRLVDETGALASRLDALHVESEVAQGILVNLDREHLGAQRTAVGAIYALSDEVRDLRRRVAELERTLASMERRL